MTLTAREWALFEALVQRRGRILSKPQLEERLYSFDQDVDSNGSRCMSAACARNSDRHPRNRAGNGLSACSFMIRTHAIQFRLALWLCLGLTSMWIAASAMAVYVLRHEMNEVFDSSLQETAQRILPLAVMEIIDRGEDGEQRVAATRPHDERIAIWSATRPARQC